MKKYASTIITFAVLGLFVWYGLVHREIFQSLKQVSIISLVLIVIGRLINIWTTGLFTKWTVEAFTDTLSQSESFVVAVLTAIGNFFGPLFGGLGIRAIYLKKYHNLPYSKFTATLIGYYLMMFQFNSLLAIGSLLALPHTDQTGFVLAIFVAWFVVFFLLTFVKLPPRERMRWLSRHKPGSLLTKVLYDIEDGWKVLVGNRKLLVQMLVLAVANLLTLYLINYVEFRALGIHVSPAAMGLYTAIVQASLLLSITPGAVGIREAALLVLAGTLGITNQQIIQVAILDRGIYFLLLGVLFMVTRHSKLRKSLVSARAAETA
ncbi:MAG TPA: lysylphosphatidylglycerol synthase transmembrane domain-containing protein [Candidatus Saccharimonadales bacterium]|nr:lysylphosphatidylglycerol synthase transmembrane domain-containing protein [Candidatus Saccharimonadales bacterium]